MMYLASGFTWFQLIPGFAALEEKAAHAMPPSLLDKDPVHIVHIALAALATLIIISIATLVRGKWSSSSDAAIPDGSVSVRNFIEVILDTALSMSESILGSKEEARRFLPLIGTLAIYILVSNLLGLVPGLAPPTDNLNVTIAPALLVFFVTHFVGIKAQGFHYVEHFLGPKFGGIPLLAPLFIVLEVISHLARPASLSLRLMGNMTGDHTVMAVFLSLVPFFLPLPIYVLGTIVCVVQTLVFRLLTLVYISLAIEHSEEAH